MKILSYFFWLSFCLWTVIFGAWFVYLYPPSIDVSRFVRHAFAVMPIMLPAFFVFLAFGPIRYNPAYLVTHNTVPVSFRTLTVDLLALIGFAYGPVIGAIATYIVRNSAFFIGDLCISLAFTSVYVMRRSTVLAHVQR